MPCETVDGSRIRAFIYLSIDCELIRAAGYPAERL